MVESLLEVILYVDDMARQVAFYRETLGLEVAHPRNPDDWGELDWVAFETGACTLALHSGGTGERREGSPEIVFEVDDIERSREQLRERGVDLGAIREPAPGIRVCGGFDPEGNPFSIEEQHSE